LAYQTDRKYDAIVIMGVIEQLPQYDRALAKYVSLLRPGEYVFLDGSACTKKHELSSCMVKYIYPGNHSFFVLHDFLEKLGRTQLCVLEIFNDRYSYFLTFRQCTRHFDATGLALEGASSSADDRAGQNGGKLRWCQGDLATNGRRDGRPYSSRTGRFTIRRRRFGYAQNSGPGKHSPSAEPDRARLDVHAGMGRNATARQRDRSLAGLCDDRRHLLLLSSARRLLSVER
jgi:hypothetical protein